jgi:hypothetical protein
MDLAARGQLSDAVISFVAASDHVTFVEIERLLRPHIETKGDRAVCHGTFENIVFWAGMSPRFVEVIDEALKSDHIFMHPASYLTYMIDGGHLQMPLARREQHYKKPRWCPVCFRSIPQAENVRRKGRG